MAANEDRGHTMGTVASGIPPVQSPGAKRRPRANRSPSQVASIGQHDSFERHFAPASGEGPEDETGDDDS